MPEWQLSWRLIHKEQGPNDGMVPVESSRYGEAVDVWEGDHLSVVNWGGPMTRLRYGERDRVADYAQLVRRLADAGF